MMPALCIQQGLLIRYVGFAEDQLSSTYYIIEGGLGVCLERQTPTLLVHLRPAQCKPHAVRSHLMELGPASVPTRDVCELIPLAPSDGIPDPPQ